MAQERFTHWSLNSKPYAIKGHLKGSPWAELGRKARLCGHPTWVLGASRPEAWPWVRGPSIQPSTCCPELLLKGSFLEQGPFLLPLAGLSIHPSSIHHLLLVSELAGVLNEALNFSSGYSDSWPAPAFQKWHHFLSSWPLLINSEMSSLTIKIFLSDLEIFSPSLS